MPAILQCVRDKNPCVLISFLNRVRNDQMKVLRHCIGPKMFDKYVLRVRSHDLDPLAKSRTLNSLTWTAMEEDVEEYESMFTHWLQIMSFVQVLMDLHRKVSRITDVEKVTRILHGFLGYSSAAEDIHRKIALERRCLELLVKDKEKDISNKLKIIARNITALGTPTNLMRFKIVFEKKTFRLVAMDEISKSYFTDYTQLLGVLSPWINEQTKFALTGDPCQTNLGRNTLPTMVEHLYNYQTDASPLEWLPCNIH